jgi:tRNA (guanine37-N1)-methyltransferase
MKFNIISIFPEFFEGPLSCGMLRVAHERGIVDTKVVNPRDFASDRVVDDYQFGGGAGMVFKPEPLSQVIKSVQTPESLLVNLSPKGNLLDQTTAKDLAQEKHIIILCGRYKGIDERIIQLFNPMEISIGDYVLSGGETGALVLMESIVRLLPGVLGNQDSASTDSFGENLLEAPIYTRPGSFRRMKVPQVLRSGDHNRIADWRRKKSIEMTLTRKPKLLSEEPFSERDLQILLEVLNGKNS